MDQMLVIMDVRYDICEICMRYVVYSLWKVRCKVKVVHDFAIEAYSINNLNTYVKLDALMGLLVALHTKNHNDN